ncbi:MAG: hypothetical protein GY772_25220 [bacterium]|nr:hypothetical protein [bacterium]
MPMLLLVVSHKWDCDGTGSGPCDFNEEFQQSPFGFAWTHDFLSGRGRGCLPMLLWIASQNCGSLGKFPSRAAVTTIGPCDCLAEFPHSPFGFG